MHLKLSDFGLRNLLLLSTLIKASIKAKPNCNTDPGSLVKSRSQILTLFVCVVLDWCVCVCVFGLASLDTTTLISAQAQKDGLLPH